MEGNGLYLRHGGGIVWIDFIEEFQISCHSEGAKRPWESPAAMFRFFSGFKQRGEPLPGDCHVTALRRFLAMTWFGVSCRMEPTDILQLSLSLKNSPRKIPWAALHLNYLLRRVTSWAPPSTMETEETRVSLASRCRSGMFRTPQLHMVDLTLYREASTLSCRGPA